MQRVPRIVQNRQQRRQQADRRPGPRLGLACGTLVGLLSIVAGLLAVLAYLDLLRALPSIDMLPVLLDPPDGALLQPTRLYDRQGQLLLILENPAAHGWQYRALNTFAPELITATLVTTDPTFWTNPGYTLDGLNQGTHPTIAQRLVAELLLWDEPPGLRRNLRERILAAQLTAHFGRARVLEWYLNSAHYGALIYGAEAAAQVYLGKPASELTLGEATWLVAVAEAPGLNPFETPEVAITQRQAVLQALLMRGLITTEQTRQAWAENINLAAPVDGQNPAPAFTNLALEQLATLYPLERLERGGLNIYTTLNLALQQQVNCAAAAELATLQGLAETASLAPTAPCPAARLLPTLPPGAATLTETLRSAAVILDPLTGEILALAGSTAPGLDPTQRPGHPPGALVTPFIYLTAFARGLSPATLLWDIPNQATDDLTAGAEPASAGLAAPLNSDGRYHGPLRLRTAFANDYLAPAEQVLAQIGPENVYHTIETFGLAPAYSLVGAGPTDPLLILTQNSEMTLLDLGRAYGSLGNQGLLAGQNWSAGASAGRTANLQPVVILEVTGVDGAVWLARRPAQTQAIVTPQLAYLVTNLLSDETARWPSLGHPNPLEIGRPAAAKLSLVAQGQSAWTVGYTPQLVVGVWLGYPAGVSGPAPTPQAAAALWHALIQYASRDLAVSDWERPAGLSTVTVCDPSGLLPTVHCPSVVSELFLSGAEPTQTDTIYRAFQINRETGHLATVFTPPALVEEQVYLMVPPQAAAWARLAGLPTPPDSYDVIYAPPQASPEVQISAPQMFANVRGQVAITGSAGGANFAYYRLQVGQGLNPQVWYQVSADLTTPVSNGVLATWDTHGLQGLYALRLLVVRQDQRVESVVLQVTVDNEPPSVTILQPGAGQQFPYTAGKVLVFQAEASDGLTLARLDYYLDGKLINTLSQPPFTIPWTAQLGAHTLWVVATDLAGNTAEQSLTFTVK
jgi:membrane peptidoglycan carboxypeptidase